MTLFEAVAYVLWYTAVFAVEFTAAVLAIVLELLVLLIRLVRALARATWELILDVLAWRRAPRELAVRHYPVPRSVPPRASAQLPPRELKQ